MKDQSDKIADIFSEKLSGHESSVDPGVWSAVQSGIASGGAAAGGLSLAAKVIIGLVVGTVATTAVVLMQTSETQIDDSSPVVETLDNTSQDNINSEVQTEAERSEALTNQSSKTASNTNDKASKEKASIKNEDPKTEMSYVSEVVASDYTIARGAPQKEAPNVAQDQPVSSEEADTQQSNIQQDEKELVALNSMFVANRSSSNPMQFTFSATDVDSYTYEWRINGAVVPGNAVMTNEFDEEGLYEVQLVINDDSRTSEPHGIVIQAYEQPSIELPNVFTPNGDMFNPLFDPTAYSTNVTINLLQVFDMNGNLVFETTDEPATWDGNDAYGNPCEVGNYLCVCEGVGIDQKPYKTGQIVHLKR